MSNAALLVRVTAILASILVGLLAVPSAARAATTTTVDLADVPQGAFDQSSFARDGVVFTQGTFVGFVQGRNALIGPVAGDVKGGFSRVSAQVAPAYQGTAAYTLTALRHGTPIGSTTIVVTQDEGDPATGPFGYFTIGIDALPRKADGFSLENRFVRSSFPGRTVIDFGVASMTFAR